MDDAHGAVLYGGSSLADELGESTPGGGLAAELGKVADKYSWMVILSNRKHIEELRRAPEDVLSFFQATTDVSNYPVPQELTCILAFRPFSCPALFFRWRSQRHEGFEQCACLPSSHRMPVSRMVASTVTSSLFIQIMQGISRTSIQHFSPPTDLTTSTSCSLIDPLEENQRRGRRAEHHLSVLVPVEHVFAAWAHIWWEPYHPPVALDEPTILPDPIRCVEEAVHDVFWVGLGEEVREGRRV